MPTDGITHSHNACIAMLIAPATTMVGANGVLPANRVCFCGSNRVQIASHSSPSTLIANHQNTTGNRPNMPTAKPISNVVVTSPNPKAPGLMSASAHCSTADNAANNRACNARNSELTDNAYVMSTMTCAKHPTAIHMRGMRRARISSTLTAIPQSRLGRQIMYHIPLR